MVGISVDIDLGTDKSKSKGSVSGSVTHQITPAEAAKFNVDDGKLKGLVSRAINNPVHGAWLHDPTTHAPYSNMYKYYSKNNWNPVTVTLAAKSVEIVDMTPESQMAGHNTIYNDTPHPVQHTAGGTTASSESVEHSWSNSQSFELGQSISYSIGIPGVEGVSGETSFKYNQQWGKSGTHKKEVQLTVSNSVQSEVPAGQWETTYIWGTVSTVKARVTYEATLSGDCAFTTDWKTPHDWWGQGHRDHCMGINEVLSKSNLPQVATITETLSIGFYSAVDLYVTPHNFDPHYLPKRDDS
ncbi:hypothetical protein [Salinifilum ghardaiensis]